MNNSNIELGEKFARDFNKKYGVITYSGTLAIEIALSSLNLKKDAKVLILSEACYSIVNTILKLNLMPVIIAPENSFYLTNTDIDKVLEREQIDCILLVHQYGILNDIDLNAYKDQGIKIIEDVAQSWNIDYAIGKYSDIVVTSFGKTKPLSYGVGGGLFFDDKSIFNYIDFYDNDSREKENILFSYTYPCCENIEYDSLKKVADSVVREQRQNAKKYYDLIKNSDVINSIQYSDKSVWHRFPIWVFDKDLYVKMIKEFRNLNLEYQLPHDIDLADLRRNSGCIKYSNQLDEKNIILLRTRNVDIDKQLKKLEIIMEKLNI